MALVLVVGILVPLVAEVFLRWLAAPVDYWPEATQALLLRFDIVLLGWIALDTYTALIRGGDRAVLSLWPVDPAQVVRFEMIRLASDRLFLVPAAAVLLGPIALVDPLLWALCVVQLLGCWLLALTSSAMVILFAVDAAHAPTMRPWLDLVRGNNHPAQAAFLYAPAVVLLGSGALLQAAAVGVSWVHAGDPLGAPLLLLPLVLAPLAWIPVPNLARRNWFRAGQAMAEVDARYAVLEDREDALRVYFDWVVRFLPVRLARYTLLDLRQGWRAQRTWLMGAWLAAIASVAAAWTADPGGPARSAAIAALGAWLVGTVALQLHRGEPVFLRAILPDPVGPKLIGRALVVVLWLQPVVWSGAIAAGIRQGAGAFGLVFAVALGSSVAAAVVGTACTRRGGLPLYGPIAATAALLAVRGLVG